MDRLMASWLNRIRQGVSEGLRIWMDGQTDGQMVVLGDRWKDTWTEEGMGEWLCMGVERGWTDIQVQGQTGGQTSSPLLSPALTLLLQLPLEFE